MIYGDHYGISENHNNAMEKLLGRRLHQLNLQI